MLTCVKELNDPRYMSMAGIVSAYNKDITIWNENDVKLDPADCGLNASPTKVAKSFTPPAKGAGEMLKGTVAEMAAALVAKLDEKHAL